MNSQKIIEGLQEYVSDHKRKLIKQVLAKRTRQHTLVFEDIDKPHNINAVLRTAECFGIQDIHFIKNRNDFEVNQGITLGSANWLTLHHYDEDRDNINQCYSRLRANGYKIMATSLHNTSHSVYDLNGSEKIALVFGTESYGISEEAGKQADGYVSIPMDGFTESFNLSVSAAICLTTLKLKSASWSGLNEDEKQDLTALWYRQVVREADLILKQKGIDV